MSNTPYPNPGFGPQDNPFGQAPPPAYGPQGFGQPGSGQPGYGPAGFGPPPGYGPPPPSGGGASNVLMAIGIGCGVVTLLTLIVCGGMAYRGYQFAKGVPVMMAKIMLEVTIDSNQALSPEEKSGMKAQVERVTGGVEAGKITVEDFTKAFENFNQTPVMKAVSSAGTIAPLVEQPGLDPNEKAAAKLTAARITRGVLDGKIESQTVFDIVREHSTALEMMGLGEPEEDEEMEEADDESEPAPPRPPAPIDPEAAKAAQAKALEATRTALEKLDAEADRTGVSKNPADLKIDYVGEVKRFVDEKFAGKGI